MWCVCMRRPPVWMACYLLLFPSLNSVSAAILTWQGDVSANWLDGQVGVDTNWIDNGGNHVLPSPGDELVFTSTGDYTRGPLTLGGSSIVVNKITVGVANDWAQSTFSPDQVFAGNGRIQLGSGGLTVHLPDGNASGIRDVHFNNDFQFTADSFICSLFTNKTAPGPQRQVHLNGQLSGGSSSAPITFELSSPDGLNGPSKAIVVAKAMPDLNGTLKLNGAVYFEATDNAIWGNTEVHLSSGGTETAYAFKAGGDVVVPNNMVLSTGRRVLLSSYGGNRSWTFTGDITGGYSLEKLDLLGDTGGKFVFAGSDQSFNNLVRIWSGMTATVANAGSDGVAWPNVPEIFLKFIDNCPGDTALRLQGDYTLNAPVTVREWDSAYSDPVQIGQVNDGATASNAVFNGRITVSEDDYQALQLTADAGGSAAFNGEIHVAGGVYGFDKIGAGTVAVNGRVSQASANSLPIGDVRVQEGTLLVNNPGGTDSFHASQIRVADGAVLGGSGTVTSDVVLGNGSYLAPGADIGTFTIEGNADFTAGGILEMHLNGTEGDRLDVGGLLDLSGTADSLWFDILAGGPGPPRILATYGSLAGEFDDLFNLPDGYSVVYNYLGENQIALVPEPNPLLLLLIGIVGIACSRFRRRAH